VSAAPSAPAIVIGNGPVGQTMALLLARWQVPVVVLDARTERRLVGSKAICQQRDVLDIWDHVGVGGRLAAEGVTWTRARTFYRGYELFCTEFRDAGASCFPPFVNISQCRTEQALDEAIAQQPLVEVRWAHRVVGLEQHDGAVTVVCETPAGTATFTGCYAVACPGSRGDDVRRLLGVRFAGHTFGDRFLICDVRTDLPGWERERRFYFDPEWNPGRQVLIHPCPDSTYRIDWQVPEGFDLAAEEAAGGLDRRIRQVIGDRDYEIVWKSVYRFGSRVVDRMRVGRVLLAGDGAHVVAPFGARGLNSGVMDAENAAWKLAFVIRGWAPESLLDSYHDERHAAAVENLTVTGATMRFLVPQSEEEWQRRRQTLEQARHDEAARRRVDSGRLAEPFWYVDSPLTTPDPSRPFAGRPAKGDVPPPAPGIVMPDFPVAGAGGDTTRLRQLLRRAITVLTGPAVDPALCTALEELAAPTRLVAFDDLAPGLAAAVGARPDEAWLVRPDAYVSAVLHDPDPAQLGRSLDTLLSRRRRAVVG
jgi:2-polyprenyl-6-methoxyphenol hydroxylase-like FAD-dependent oxidoreductase